MSCWRTQHSSDGEACSASPRSEVKHSTTSLPTTGYNTDLDITQSCCGSKIFFHGILQRNYRKMTNGHFPIIPL